MGQAKKKVLFLLVSISLLHLLAVFNSVTSISEFLSQIPFLTQDYALHFYHTVRTGDFIAGSGEIWGYDPAFMAGYPACTVFDISFKFGEFFTYLLSSFLHPAVAFKLFVVLTFSVIPLLLFFAAKNFGFTDGEALTFTLLGILYWWFSLFREMVFYGMSSYVFICYLAIYLLALLYRYLKTDYLKSYLLLTGFAPLLLLFHVLSPIIIFVPALTLLVVFKKKLKKRTLFFLVITALLSLLFNLFWLKVFYMFRDDISTDIVKYFVSYDPLTFVKDYFSSTFYWSYMKFNGKKIFALYILIFGIIGFHEWKKEERDIFYPVLAGVLFLFFLTYFGSFLNFTADLQPYRYKLPMNLLLLLPASVVIRRFVMKKTIVVLSIVLLISIAPMIKAEIKKPFKIKSTYDPPLESLASWIRNETTNKGRILIEDSGDETDHQYYNIYFPALLPYLTGREFIGGPYPYFLTKHHFSTFFSAWLFGKKITAFSSKELKGYMDLFNIKWIITFHPVSIRYFSNYPQYFRLKGRIDKFYIFEVNRQPSFFIKGSGKIRAELNNIYLEDLHGKEIIIKYHWFKGLTGGDGVKVSPVYYMDDPVPFIKVEGGGKSVKINNSYKMGAGKHNFR